VFARAKVTTIILGFQGVAMQWQMLGFQSS